MKLMQLIVTFFSLILSLNLNAKEVITSYHSDISIQQNGQLHIVETIQVTAENNQIKRGIYRDFPTIYKDEMGNFSKVGFELLSVKRDGISEDFHTQKKSNGIRIYIGNKNIILTPGSYRYQIEFNTTRQLGFFDDYDELYFNVTGNGWSFPIQQASATITLPQTVDSNSISLTGYTGRQGSTEQNLTHHIQSNGKFYFETTHSLSSFEGLTIVANWPRGIISEPGAEQAREQFIEDNKHSVIALAGLLGVMFYYLLIWMKVGKDPEKGIILPLYQAPDGFSPASTRFISRMSYDKSCFTAALVNLTVKGFISIDQNSSKKFVITKQEHSSAELAAGESIILQQLFSQSDQITLTQSEHRRLAKAIQGHEASLREDFEKLHFITNKKFFFPAILMSLGIIIFSFMEIPDTEIMASTIIVSMFSIVPFIIIASLFKIYLKKRKPPSIFKMATQIFSFGVMAFILSDIVSSLSDMINFIAWPVVIGSYLLVAINILFEQWLKAPTLAGRKLLDKIDSFKLYLNVAEEDELKLSGQPTFSSDIYQQFLPYAIALGVDHAWSKKLERSIEAGLVQQDYQPDGFMFHNRYNGFSDFSSSLSSGLDSAISSSSTAPGSSSGSSGGGSSGGGGGGGGGGGW